MTYLRASVIYGSQHDLNSPTDSVMPQHFDASSVRPTNFNYEVALGRRDGYTTWNKFGYNADIDIGTEIVASFGGTFTILTSASTLTIVSSSIADDGSPAGTGANTILITGIDANYVAQSETVTLNGTSNVVTATTWLGINRAQVTLSGSGQTNAGTITITATTGGSTQGQIPTGEGTTQQCIFFTQADHKVVADTLKINAEKTSGGSTPKVTFKGWLFNSVTNTKYLIFRQLMDTSVENSFTLIPSQPFVIPEKCCLYFEATTDTNDTQVSVRFSLLEVRDFDA